MKKNKGFTLIELSVVLVILGFLTTMSVNMTRGYINYQKHANTKDIINIINNALYSYVLKYKRLPCPAKIDKNYKKTEAP